MNILIVAVILGALDLLAVWVICRFIAGAGG